MYHFTRPLFSRWAPACAALLSAALLASCGSEPPAPPAQQGPSAPVARLEPTPPPPTFKAPESNLMEIDTTSGKIVIQLLPEKAPKTVDQIKALAASGFYNGIGFHRVIPDLIIQGGDPNTKDSDPTNDGAGGYSKKLPFEDNDLPFTAGAVAMARKGDDKGSASSQFFICLKNYPGWKGQYAVFGRVSQGLDVARKISRMKTAEGTESPEEPQVMKKVTFIEEKASKGK